MSVRARDVTVPFARDSDAARLTRVSLACVALIYGHLLLAAAGVLPPWTLALSVPLLVPRWMIAVHELFHVRSDREVDVVTRLQPLVFTPPALGYREMLSDHRSHHRFMATPQDAEFYELRGSPVAGFLNALTAPEQMWFRWIGAHGADRTLMRDTTLRCVLFVSLVAIAGPVFLWCWIPARLTFATSYFVFFYCLHRRGATMGVYALRLPPPATNLLTLLFGTDVVEATRHHDVHHAQPRIAARDLATARATLGL